MVNLYGLVLALAVFISYSLTACRAKKRGLSSKIVWDSLPWVLFFGILGARLYHVINYFDYYLQNPILIPQVWLGGLGIFGALFGGFLGLLLYFKYFANVILSSPERRIPACNALRSNAGRSTVGILRDEHLRVTGEGDQISNFKFQILEYLDAAAPAIVLGQAMGRVGNIFNKENLPYAYWEILLDAVILLLLLSYEWFSIYRKSRGNVSMFKIYLLLYSLGRFILEFFRNDSPWIWGPLSVAQWICLIISLIILTKLFFDRSGSKFRFGGSNS